MPMRNVEPLFYPGATQSIAIGASSVSTTAMDSYTQAIRLYATSDCFVAFGTTATTSSMFIPANFPSYFRTKPAQTISVIQYSTSGTLYVTEMTH